MFYAEARPIIRSGDLLAWRGETLVGRVIRHVTGGSWTHVGIAWVFRGRVFVLEAREGAGVGLRAVSQALPCDWIATGAVWSDTIETAALDQLGKPYDYADAFRVGLGLATPMTGAICSIYAATILIAAGAMPVTSASSPEKLIGDRLDAGRVLRGLTA